MDREGKSFDLFAGCDEDTSSKLQPAFRLVATKGQDTWSLYSLQCEQCEALGRRQCGIRDLAYIHQYSEKMGSSGCALCMDMNIPSVQTDGTYSIMCGMCNERGSTNLEEPAVTSLTSKRPKWNTRTRSLTMDFNGRCKISSAKNFQLEVLDTPGKVKLLHGKIKANEFVLDYSFPLCAVQAFAATLSASHWT